MKCRLLMIIKNPKFKCNKGLDNSYVNFRLPMCHLMTYLLLLPTDFYFEKIFIVFLCQGQKWMLEIFYLVFYQGIKKFRQCYLLFLSPFGDFFQWLLENRHVNIIKPNVCEEICSDHVIPCAQRLWEEVWRGKYYFFLFPLQKILLILLGCSWHNWVKQKRLIHFDSAILNRSF